MSSKKIYDVIYSKNITNIESGDIIIDDYLQNHTNDPRMGVSLIIPIRSLSTQYDNLVTMLQQIEPNQYYYPFEDLHITVFDFIKGTSNYIRNKELEMIFIEISEEAIKEIKPFFISFNGIVANNGAAIIQGYNNDILIKIRESIRNILKKHGIVNDERYKSESAHITFMRFKNSLLEPKIFSEYIKKNRTKELGNEEIKNIELVEHDWYNRKETKRIIRSLMLMEDS